jgi:glycoside/pentoside/hexuronide:cation symporter, GPH family
MASRPDIVSETDVPRPFPRTAGDPVARARLAAVAGPGIVAAGIALPLVVYLPEHYASHAGMSLSAVGAVFMLIRLTDIVVDPVLGGMMDHTRTRFGRFRPWLAVSAPLLLIGVHQLFIRREIASPVDLLFWLVIIYAGYSIATLSQLALAAGLSPDYDERSRVYAWVQSGQVLGMVGAMALPALVVDRTADNASGVILGVIGWLIIGASAALYPFALLFTAERTDDVMRARTAGSGWTALSDTMRLLRRPVTARLMLIDLLYGFATGIPSATSVFFFTRVKELTRADFGLMITGHLLAALIAAPLWGRVAKSMEKHRALALAGLILCAAHAGAFFLPVGNFALAGGVLLATGVVLAAQNMLPRAMMADVNDLEELEGGVERAGLLYSLLVATSKIGQAVSVGIVYWLLSRTGFNAAATAHNSPASLLSLSLIYTGLPAALALFAAALAFRYPLTARRYAEIRSALDRRQSETLSLQS